MREPPPEMVAQLEQRNGLAGKKLADIPALAQIRYTGRRNAYRFANIFGGLAIFNFVVAVGNPGGLWVLSAATAGFNVFMVVKCEGFARTMSRQLQRPAAYQAARDILGIPG